MPKQSRFKDFTTDELMILKRGCAQALKDTQFIQEKLHKELTPNQKHKAALAAKLLSEIEELIGKLAKPSWHKPHRY